MCWDWPIWFDYIAIKGINLFNTFYFLISNFIRSLNILTDNLPKQKMTDILLQSNQLLIMLYAINSELPISPYPLSYLVALLLFISVDAACICDNIIKNKDSFHNIHLS